MDNFGDAPVMREGGYVSYGGREPTPEEIQVMKNQPHSTWIEFPVPEEWEDECWKMVAEWCRQKHALFGNSTTDDPWYFKPWHYE